jgi:Ca2+-binding RTX toxin-like protein
MATRTINGNNAGNSINVSNFSLTPGSGYKVTGASSISPAGSAPFFDTDLVINTLDATGGTDVVDLSGLTTNSGVSFTSITINGSGGSQIVTGSGFAETISTGAGNDTINSGAGDDTLTGGDGADSWAATPSTTRAPVAATPSTSPEPCPLSFPSARH